MLGCPGSRHTGLAPTLRGLRDRIPRGRPGCRSRLAKHLFAWPRQRSCRQWSPTISACMLGDAQAPRCSRLPVIPNKSKGGEYWPTSLISPSSAWQRPPADPASFQVRPAMDSQRPGRAGKTIPTVRLGQSVASSAQDFQTSIVSAISIASSISIPRYRTVLSILLWPSKSCTARRLPVRR